jgi:hypothetical protein
MPASQPVPIAIGRVVELAQFSGPPLAMPLTIVRGDSLELVFRLYRRVDECGHGSGVQTLTGLQARAAIRRAPDHPVIYALTATVDTTAGSGRVTLSASAAVTRLLPDHGVWDVEINDGTDALRKTIAGGPVLFLRDVATG